MDLQDSISISTVFIFFVSSHPIVIVFFPFTIRIPDISAFVSSKDAGAISFAAISTIASASANCSGRKCSRYLFARGSGYTQVKYLRTLEEIGLYISSTEQLPF
jgi:hypothetical protein